MLEPIQIFPAIEEFLTAQTEPNEGEEQKPAFWILNWTNETEEEKQTENNILCQAENYQIENLQGSIQRAKQEVTTLCNLGRKILFLEYRESEEAKEGATLILNNPF